MLIMAKDKREFTGVFIPACIWESKELTPAEKMMLGEIIALSESRGYCSAGRQHFADWLDCTLPNISYMYKKLENMGYLSIEREPGKSPKMIVNKSLFYTRKRDLPVNGIDGGSKPDLPLPVNGIDGGSKPHLPEIQYKGKSLNTIENTTLLSVVDFLNQCAGAEFRPNSKSTAEPISARLKEGFSEDDLKLVVEHKNLQWGADPKMFEYLRPKTLFGQEKFESYLQAAKRWQASGKPSLTQQQKNGAYKQTGEDRSTTGAFS